MIVAGFGFRGSAEPQSLREVFDAVTLGRRIDLLAAPEDKIQSPAFRAFAARFDLDVLGIAPGDLEAQITATTSAASMTARRTGSVAEAAALAAAGSHAQLLAPRRVSKDGQATCALAKGGNQ